jgi:hypothetical protein
MRNTQKYGVFYKTHGVWTKSPYLGEIMNGNTVRTYKKYVLPSDKKLLKSKIVVRPIK